MMDAIFINSGNSKTFNPRRLFMKSSYFIFNHLLYKEKYKKVIYK